MASEKFNIDDAFQSDDEDPIRLYGATCVTENAPLRGKSRPSTQHSAHRQSHGANEIEDCECETVVKDESTDKAGLLPIQGQRFGRSGSSHSFNSSYSDSTGITNKTFPDKRWWRHPKVRENWKIVLASFVLMVLGIGLIIAGVAIEATKTEAVQSFIFFIAGVICLIPGAYHVIYIYCAVKGKRGFSFANIPVLK